MRIVNGLRKGNSIKFLNLGIKNIYIYIVFTNLGFNKIQDKGGEYLVELIKDYPKLEHLYLGGNDFGDNLLKRFINYYYLLPKPTIRIDFTNPVKKDNNRFIEIFHIVQKQKWDNPQSFSNLYIYIYINRYILYYSL